MVRSYRNLTCIWFGICAYTSSFSRVMRVSVVGNDCASLAVRSHWCSHLPLWWLQWVAIVRVDDDLRRVCIERYWCFFVPAYYRLFSMVRHTSCSSFGSQLRSIEVAWELFGYTAPHGSLSLEKMQWLGVWKWGTHRWNWRIWLQTTVHYSSISMPVCQMEWCNELKITCLYAWMSSWT